MKFLGAALAGVASLLSLQVAASPVAPPVEGRQASGTISNKVIFSPPSNAGWVDPRVLYARAVQLSSGDLLATWENYSPEPPIVYFPIFRSQDGGATWTEIGRVQDTVNGWGLRYQPMLYELPAAFAGLPAGALLLVGNSIPTDLSLTKLDVYASTDGGVTWTFQSAIASGGEARPTNGLTPVWEPFLMLHNDKLIAYYADQRDPKFGQKLAHATTTDLKTWSPVINDVADTTSYEARPGMPVITKLPNNDFLFAFEVCGTDGCRVHYRVTADPENILAAADVALVSDKGTRPVSSPFVVWTPVGGANGTIVLSGGSQSNIFVNRALGDPSAWVEFPVPQPNAYSRSLAVLGDGSQIAIIGGGWLPPSANNQVSVSVVDLKALLKL
ncbi:family 93 glycoside hydrolase [Colletotrichum sublineola]|uniref:Putative glycoside hydrolase family 93 n=1 Tax=Colletotrichum sublineola TaxID=1173701 RepID=A0A066XJB9_COLSU|nr:family 93 glycoside hydrolase [Colletotrichum sublineola]KDN67734.1 putative glycoside hydrolase family 93 [Colletotrichum sublineola]